MKRLLIVLLMAAAAPAVQAKDTAESVLACMRGTAPASVRVQGFELKVTEPKGETRSLSGRLYAQREAKGKDGLMHAMMRVDDPSHLKGAAYLVRETDDYLRDGMYIYLPSLRRVRRVTGTFADGSLLGTSFSYYDFKQLSSAFGDLDAKLESPAEIQSRKVHVLHFTAKPGTETTYSSVRTWVDQQTCLPLKVEFNVDEKPRKRLTANPDALRTDGNTKFISQMEMVDLSTNTRTELIVTKANVGSKDVSPRYFDPNTFYLGN